MRRLRELKRTAGALRKSIDDLASWVVIDTLAWHFFKPYTVAQLFEFADPSSIKDQLKLAELDSLESLRL
jgi:hypothetical protein